MNTKKNQYTYLNSKQTAKFERYNQTDTEWCTATIALTYRNGNSASHFSMTAEAGHVSNGRRQNAHSFGCMHDKIAEHFPELERYIKWHLTGMDQPMHYIANGLHHLGLAGYPDARNLDRFKSTVILGVMPEDNKMFDQYIELESALNSNPLLEDRAKRDALKGMVTAWLEGRKEKLMQAFDSNMRALFQFEDTKEQSA